MLTVDYFDIRIVGYGYGDYKPILAFVSLLSDDDPFFTFKSPEADKKFDFTVFPEYLREIIKRRTTKELGY